MNSDLPTKTEEAIFLDDTLSELEAFFSNPKNANKHFWANCAEIKQVHEYTNSNSDSENLMKTLYIRGYYTLVDYNEGDFFVFKTEDSLKEYILGCEYTYIFRHESFIDPNGMIRKIIPQISVRFE